MEQYGGRTVPASDLYSLGVTLIHLLTGIAPADLPQTDRGIQFQDHVSGSPAFINWVAKLTHPLLRQRFVSARESLKYLDVGLSISPKPTTPIKAARPYGSQIELHVSSQQLEAKLPYLKSPAIFRAAFNEATILSIWLILLFVTIPVMMANSSHMESLVWTFLITIVMPLPIILCQDELRWLAHQMDCWGRDH